MIPVKKIQLEYVRETKIKCFSKVNYKISEISKKFQLGFFYSCIWNKPRVRDGRSWRSWNPSAEPAPSRRSVQAENAVFCQPYKGHVLEEQQSEDITTFQGFVSCLAHLICYSITPWVWVRLSTRKPFNHGAHWKVSQLLRFPGNYLLFRSWKLW